MSYKETFPDKHTFLAVVHMEHLSQAIDQSRLAMENGADGLFLIGHQMTTGETLSAYNAVKQHVPTKTWVGLNLLRERIDFELANSTPLGCPGIWTDESGLYHRAKFIDTSSAKRFQKQIRCKNPDILWFGGVAFKGQLQPIDISNFAIVAKNFMDVVTTSGDKTGSPPSIEKLAMMREAINDHPLANASGTTPENVHLMKPYVDCFLVASSILKPGSFTEFDPSAVRDMYQAIKA